MANKLINDLSLFSFDPDHRGNIEIHREGQTATRKVGLRHAHFNREMECLRDRIWTESGVGNATMTIIPVYSINYPSNQRVFQVTIEIYLSSSIAGDLPGMRGDIIPEGFRPPTRKISRGAFDSYAGIRDTGTITFYVDGQVDYWQGFSFTYTTG